MNSKELIKILELENEYEEFRKVMNEVLIKFELLGISEDVVIENLFEKIKKEKSILGLIFLDAYEDE
ncbi:MAG: hypothetical protein CBR30_01700 [Dictyoglomus sp. NZ13-RE01]|nr:MAG: hypothetical protein CBR30_01700 [Dictyoglomus sp. NZ13-RE01]